MNPVEISIYNKGMVCVYLEESPSSSNLSLFWKTGHILFKSSVVLQVYNIIYIFNIKIKLNIYTRTCYKYMSSNCHNNIFAIKKGDEYTLISFLRGGGIQALKQPLIFMAFCTFSWGNLQHDELYSSTS